MNRPKKVTGAQCLEYIRRPIGFCSQTNYSASAFRNYVSGLADPRRHIMNTIIKEEVLQNKDVDNAFYRNIPLICKFNHDVSKRIIGYVMEQYDDGGYKIAILGNEILDQNPAHGKNKNCEFYNHEFTVVAQQQYKTNLDLSMDADGTMPLFPEVVQGRMQSIKGTYTKVSLTDYDRDSEFARGGLSYEEMLDYKADFSLYDINGETQPNLSDNYKQLTNDPETTMIFGEGEHHVLHMNSDLMGDPLSCLQGDMYQLAVNKLSTITGAFPRHFENSSAWQNFELDMGVIISSFNMVCVPYNIILTDSLQFAQAYLSDGSLPPDAYLFPIDWSKLPTYEAPDDPDDPSDNPPDEPDNNTPNDEDDDIIDNPPVAPDNTPAMFTNYNWYWLSIGDYSAFINWFWNDIGNFNDFSDIIAKIEGLYNDLASAVIMIRYMPVNPTFIGGINETREPIRIGMIEKANTTYETLALNRPPIVEIGNIDITRRYSSFLDFAPYSQLSLYLPYHGYIDLDINIFSGHKLVIYGVYDILSGTLQYMIYRQRAGKRMLVNTVLCKIAVDIPITLQTKNDRDSAIFQNVSSTVGGLIGAVGGVASGNPIGAMIGVTSGINALSSTNASAPLNVKGNVAETGAMYAPHKCSIILRSPTIQGSDSDNAKTTWLKHIGRSTSFGYYLNSDDMKNAGLIVCANPRITFTETTPLQTEVDEIYDYLTKGVIL